MSSASRGSALPREGGRPRVQRVVDALRPVHLEREIPARATWELGVDGLVARPLRLSLAELAGLPVGEQEIDFHCVWGWSRPGCRWHGVHGAVLLERCQPLQAAGCAVLSAIDGPYSSCMRLEDLADGMLAFELDGHALPPEHGGPLRFVPPARLWGYKGVKWLGRMTFVERFEPGFWEQKVGDVEGRVPEAILALFDATARGAMRPPAGE